MTFDIDRHVDSLLHYFSGSAHRSDSGVAISAIQVLKAFMNMDTVFEPQKLAWLVGVHFVFVISAFMLALSDRWSGGDHAGE